MKAGALVTVKKLEMGVDTVEASSAGGHACVVNTLGSSRLISDTRSPCGKADL